MDDKQRCAWARHPLEIDYHDQEWGIPFHDDTRLFEMLNLEGAQAGLSWLTVLKKRRRYREVFDNFDASRMAAYDAKKVESLLADDGIIRNRLKVAAFIENAKAYLRVIEDCGSFSRWLWDFVGGEPIVNHPRRLKEVPATSMQSDAMSKELRRRGFRFAGSTICYAFMQAVGMVDDHVVSCWRKQY